jgi:hypothetical protein
MTDAPVLVLHEGELRRHETFGRGTVNRGAVLLDCIWDGGICGWALSFRDFPGRRVLGRRVDGRRLEGRRLGERLRAGRAIPLPHRASVKVVVASAHRFPDQARLWFRFVGRDLVSALRQTGAEVEVLLFRDAPPEGFEPRHFPGATFLARSFEALDVVEFREKALAWPGDVLFLLDADVFVVDGEWVAALLGHFEDPTVVGVSLLRRGKLPGVVAFMARCAAYRAFPAPVLAPSVEGIERWPHATKRQPGDRAALALRARGKKIVDVSPAATAARLADFGGATAIRTAREVYGAALGTHFETLLVEEPDFTEGAYRNLLLGALFRVVFDAPYAVAPGPSPFAAPDGAQHLSGSATPEELREALARVHDREALQRLVACFEASDRALTRLAAREELTRGELRVPSVLPRGRVLEARAWAAARRLFGKK